jgi:hypothetical protein
MGVTEEAPELRGERDQERNKLTAAQTRHQTTSQSRAAKIADLNGKLAALEIQMAKSQKEVSRLAQLVAQNKVRLDSRNKRLMDVLKVIARNSFYKTLAPFKRDYDNYRDDHDHFRQLTRCGGVLQPGTTRVTVHRVALISLWAAKKFQKHASAGSRGSPCRVGVQSLAVATPRCSPGIGGFQGLSVVPGQPLGWVPSNSVGVFVE